MILSPQQQRVLDQLIPIARIAIDGSRRNLPVTPMTSSLIIGNSGSGKSFVASEIARQLSVPSLQINVGGWILMSSRSQPWTWNVIAEWLATLTTGGIIIIDECDKISGGTEYSAFLRLELHDLLDSRMPPSLTKPMAPDNDFEFPPPAPQPIDLKALEMVLREHVMIIGCGAFQAAWRSNEKQLGFATATQQVMPKTPSREQLLQTIDPELRMRFRDQLAVLPIMDHADYVAVAKDIGAQIPVEYRQAWKTHLGPVIRRAVENSLGMRVFQELLLTAMVISRTTTDINPEKLREPGSGLD